MTLAALLIAAALVFCIVLVVLLVRIARAPSRGTPEAPAATPPSPADTAITTDEQIDPNILARIQKEVSARLGQGARIRSVKKLEMPSERATSWAHQGRVAAHGSHKAGDRPR